VAGRMIVMKPAISLLVATFLAFAANAQEAKP
jgi:hypothetical protein